MAERNFGLVVEGVDLTSDGVVNSLMSQGIDDASFATREGRHIIYLDREGRDLITAVAAAAAELEQADPELLVIGSA